MAAQSLPGPAQGGPAELPVQWMHEVESGRMRLSVGHAPGVTAVIFRDAAPRIYLGDRAGPSASDNWLCRESPPTPRVQLAEFCPTSLTVWHPWSGPGSFLSPQSSLRPLGVCSQPLCPGSPSSLMFSHVYQMSGCILETSSQALPFERPFAPS